MFLEIRKIGKKKRYYLAHSFREDNKVRKLRRYLGEDLSQQEIDRLRKQAEKRLLEQVDDFHKIRDPLKYILSEKELRELSLLESNEDIKILHLSEKDWLKFSEMFSYDTNAIEGSTVTETEVENIIEKGKWPKDKSKEDISETYGVVEAINYLRRAKEHISLEIIKELHRIVFKNSKQFAGNFRAKGIEVGIVDSLGHVIHRGAPSAQVFSLLKELVVWYNKYKSKYPPLLLAAVVHNQFENIHPFQDGNGRVGRLLLNNILLKHRLPPVNIELRNRHEYYAALQEYEHKGNIRPMIDLILKEYSALRKSLRNR